MYRIIWTDYGDLSMPVYRNTPNPADQRPTSVDADTYEIYCSENPNIYLQTITFFKNDRKVLTLFQMPLAVENVAILPE